MKNIYLLYPTYHAALFVSLLIIAVKKNKVIPCPHGKKNRPLNFSSQSETENEVVFNDVFDNVMGVNTELGIGGTGIFGRMAANGTA